MTARAISRSVRGMPNRDAGILERNLDALARANAELAGRLRDADPNAQPPADEPAEVAAANVAEFHAKPGAGGMGPPVFVLGCGLGRRLTALLADRLADRSRQPVVVVEPDPSRIRAAMAAEDWRAAITDPRLRWAVGPDSYAASVAAFGNDPHFTFHSAQLICSTVEIQRTLTPGAPPDHWSRFVAAVREDVGRYQKNVLDSIEGYMKWRAERPVLSSLPGEEVRVFARTDSNTSALKYITADLLEAAQRAGHITHLLEEDYLNDPFLGPRRAQMILEFQPDLVVNLIQTGRQAFSTLRDSVFKGVPCAVYYSSDPRRYDVDAEQFSPDDHIFIADPDWRELFSPTGRQVHVLPLATSMHTKEVALEVDPWLCDVVMVSNLTGPQHVLPQLTAAQRQRLLKLGEQVADNRQADASDILAMLSADDLAIAPAETLRGAVEVAATWHLRRRAAILLAEAGFGLRIHGNEEWSPALAGTAAAECWKGHLDYQREVPAAYHHARVTINVGSRTASSALNMRAYDVPAIGGCLVTNAGGAIEASFLPGAEVVVYDRIEDLPRLVWELLAEPARRDAIAAAGRARVLRDHTYDRRWRDILEICGGN